MISDNKRKEIYDIQKIIEKAKIDALNEERQKERLRKEKIKRDEEDKKRRKKADKEFIELTKPKFDT